MIDACYHTLLDSLNYKTLYQSSKCLTVGDYMLRSPSSRFHLLILDLLDIPHLILPPAFRTTTTPPSSVHVVHRANGENARKRAALPASVSALFGFSFRRLACFTRFDCFTGSV